MKWKNSENWRWNGRENKYRECVKITLLQPVRKHQRVSPNITKYRLAYEISITMLRNFSDASEIKTKKNTPKLEYKICRTYLKSLKRDSENLFSSVTWKRIITLTALHTIRHLSKLYYSLLVLKLHRRSFFKPSQFDKFTNVSIFRQLCKIYVMCSQDTKLFDDSAGFGVFNL